MTLASHQKSNKAKGRLFVISGPSGVGKGTLVAAVLSLFSNLALSVSATTRPPRPGEVEGVTYHFKTNEEFDELIKNNELLEWAEVHGCRYGTLTAEVKKALDSGRSIILEIDPQGFSQVSSALDGIISIFIAPPSLDELRKRLELRATESSEALERRLRNARVEMQTKDSYTVVIINDDLEKATQELITAIRTYTNEDIEEEAENCPKPQRPRKE